MGMDEQDKANDVYYAMLPARVGWCVICRRDTRWSQLTANFLRCPGCKAYFCRNKFRYVHSNGQDMTMQEMWKLRWRGTELEDLCGRPDESGAGLRGDAADPEHVVLDLRETD
jgi:hypothetical protein